MSLYRRAKTRDGNEVDVVEALEALGAWVVRLDLPCDLLVGWRGMNLLIEVKQPHRVTKAGKIRADQPAQAEWLRCWPGQVAVVTTPEEAVRLLLGSYPVPRTEGDDAA